MLGCVFVGVIHSKEHHPKVLDTRNTISMGLTRKNPGEKRHHHCQGTIHPSECQHIGAPWRSEDESSEWVSVSS